MSLTIVRVNLVIDQAWRRNFDKYRSIGSIGLTTYVTVTGCSMMKEASSHLVDI